MVLTSQRPQDFRVCDIAKHSNDYTERVTDARQQPWGVAPIDFRYSIETDFSPLLLSPREVDSILGSLSAAVIESVYNFNCVPQHTRKRRRQIAVSSSSLSRSRRTEILSISPGIGHQLVGVCDVLSSSNNTFNNITYCSIIQGTVVIAFDGNGDPESTSVVGTDFNSVGNIVLSRVEEDMINGNYIEKVNNDTLQLGVTIFRMKYIDSDYPDLVAEGVLRPLNYPSGSLESGTSDTAGLTLFSKVVIPIMVVLLLLAMGLCWCAIKTWPGDVCFPKSRRKNLEKDSRNRAQPYRSQNVEGKRLNSPSTTRYKNSENAFRNGGFGTLSVEGTLQDLSQTEMSKYGGRNAAQSMLIGDQKNFSMNPTRDIHPSDTETGSSSYSAEFHTDFRTGPMNGGNRGRVSDDYTFRKKANQNATPIRALSSFLGRSNANGVHTTSNAENIADIISTCTSIRDDCLGGVQEQNKSNDNNAIYVVPPVGRINSLVESGSLSQPQSEEIPDTRFARMGTKKSAAYRDYIDDKMRQREAECELSDDSVPMEIGVRRTFTDSQGRIREVVAL